MRDAEELPWQRVPDDARQPEQRDVWVRIDGVWCRGWANALDRDAGGWRVWMHHELPGDGPWSWHTWFRYDPETIRARTGDEPPG